MFVYSCSCLVLCDITTKRTDFTIYLGIVSQWKNALPFRRFTFTWFLLHINHIKYDSYCWDYEKVLKLPAFYPYAFTISFS